jgi:ribonuclease HI
MSGGLPYNGRMPDAARPSLFATLPGESRAHPKPGGNWIFAHCDGGARGNPGPAGFGVLVQDAAGAVLAELSEFLGIRTNNYAEYSGLLASLDYAVANKHPRLKVTSDSELMVKQIQGRYQVKSPDLKLLFDQAKKKIAQLDGFEITHALRHKNKDADRLANEAMDRGMKRPAAGGSAAAAPARESQRPEPARESAKPDAMLRGFVKDGVVHLLGGAALAESTFVKIIPE